jgi:hypothetical protein
MGDGGQGLFTFTDICARADRATASGQREPKASE